MKLVIISLVMVTTFFVACKSNSKDPQADPKTLAEAIFDAARNGNYAVLATLIDIDADGDSKMIAQAATDEKIQKEFKEYFAKGKVTAEPVIDGDKASVNIVFGSDGTKEETFEMVKKNGKWFLQSF